MYRFNTMLRIQNDFATPFLGKLTRETVPAWQLQATAHRRPTPVRFFLSFLARFGWWGLLSSLAMIGGECSTSHFLPALFLFEVEITSRTLISLFMPGSVHSGSAS